jgi:hypothetical protein
MQVSLLQRRFGRSGISRIEPPLPGNWELNSSLTRPQDSRSALRGFTKQMQQTAHRGAPLKD